MQLQKEENMKAIYLIRPIPLSLSTTVCVISLFDYISYFSTGLQQTVCYTHVYICFYFMHLPSIYTDQAFIEPIEQKV